MSVDHVLFSSAASVASPLWVASLLLLVGLVTASGLPLSDRASASEARLILGAIIGFTALVLVAALPVPFSKLTIVGFLVMATLANLLSPRRAFAMPRLDVATWIGLGLLVLVFVWSTSRPETFMHYDYFHANMRSLDVARSGSVLSEWYAGFDPTGWYLLDQSTSIVLDGLEIIWSGTNTGILSRLYAVALAAGLVVLIGQRGNALATLLLSATLAPYLLDNAFAFRPHLYVGLCLALLAVLMAEPRPGRLIASGAIVVALALAKRDGLLLAPLAAMVVVGVALPRKIYSLKWIVAGLVVTAACVVAGLALTRIGGVPVGLQLLRSIQDIQIEALLRRPALWYLLATLALCLAILLVTHGHRRRTVVPALALVFFTAGLILASAILLEGADRFNDGTMLRKLLYFLAPVVLTMLALATDRKERLNPVRFHVGAAALAAMIGIAGVVAYQLRDIVRPHSAWGPPAVAAVSFFRTTVPDQNATIGFLAPAPADLARTPFGDVEAYQFPQMTAYLGRDLRFSDSLPRLDDRDVILLPSSISVADRTALLAGSDRSYRELEGGYGLLLNSRGVEATRSPLILETAEGAALERPLQRAPWRDIDKHWPPQFGIAEIPWPGGETQAMLAWPVDPATWSEPMPITFPNADADYVYRVEFRDHPLGDRTAMTIAVTVDGQTRQAPAGDFFHDGRYVIPIESTGPFTLSFTAESGNISPAWGVPYFAMFDLKLLQYERQGGR